MANIMLQAIQHNPADNERKELANKERYIMKATEKTSLEIYIEKLKDEECSALDLKNERELLKKASCGDKKARNKIISSNLRYVVSVAKKFARANVDLDDLVQAGNEALYESFQTFDYDKFVKSGCNRFISYAGRRIAQKIAIEAKCGIPVSISDGKYKDLKKLLVEMSAQNPELDEIKKVENAARTLGMKKNSAVELYTTTSESVSMEFQFDEDDKPLGERLRNDTFVTPENEAVMKISSELLKKCMDNLCTLEEQVLTLAYGLDGNAPLNYPAIGKQLGYTREGVRVVHNRAISHLRASMGFVA